MSQTEPEYLDAYYVAYGSNLNIHDMIERCPDALLMYLDRLYGFRLAYCGYHDNQAWLTLKPCPGHSVPVALWKITQKDKEALDLYEDTPHLYEIMNFCLHRSRCFTYVMQPTFPEYRPSEKYVACVEQGYADMGFDLLDLMSARF